MKTAKAIFLRPFEIEICVDALNYCVVGKRQQMAGLFCGASKVVTHLLHELLVIL